MYDPPQGAPGTDSSRRSGNDSLECGFPTQQLQLELVSSTETAPNWLAPGLRVKFHSRHRRQGSPVLATCACYETTGLCFYSAPLRHAFVGTIRVVLWSQMGEALGERCFLVYKEQLLTSGEVGVLSPQQARSCACNVPDSGEDKHGDNDQS